MKKKTTADLKKEILAILNIESEYNALGVQTSGKIQPSGWMACRSPYNTDAHPSCGIYVGEGSYRGQLTVFNKPDGVKLKPYLSYTFWAVALDKLKNVVDEYEVLQYYAKKAGVSFNLTPQKPPTKELIKSFQEAIPPDAREFLHTKRGLTDESIKKYEIGFRQHDKRNTFPVYDSNDNLVNIRYHSSKAKPKTLNHAGFGEARLWNLNTLAKAPPGSTVGITEGEFDSMLVEQESNIISVSPTNGNSAFSHAWVPHFYGHHVVLIFDCDRPGRDAVQKIILPAFMPAVISKKVLSIKIIWLFQTESKNHKDFTDYIVKAGGSGDKLLHLITQTPPHQYSQTQIDNPAVDPDLFFDGKSFIPTQMVNYLTENNDIFHDENDFYIYDTPKGIWQEVHPNILGKKILKGLGNKAKTIHAKDALNLLEYQTYIPPETLRPNNLLINMKNKMLDLQYMKLIPHDKKYYSRLQTPIDYDPDAKCPLLDRSLSQIFRDDPDKTITIQQFAGYCLYAEIFIHKCLFLIGEGGNGKSTIIEIISRLVGSDHVTSLNLIMLADKFMLGTLKNSMLNISTEIETREPIADHIFKQVVSGDRVQADVKYGKPFSFYPIAKHVFSMNRIPIITDRS
ncbi:MAG: hypothetical protein KKB38_20735, partial [Gammaproteobacteria bacterium]|nr:hypothetical protein [Gammaproteobacteria bacterium]